MLSPVLKFDSWALKYLSLSCHPLSVFGHSDPHRM